MRPVPNAPVCRTGFVAIRASSPATKLSYVISVSARLEGEHRTGSLTPILLKFWRFMVTSVRFVSWMAAFSATFTWKMS